MTEWGWKPPSLIPGQGISGTAQNQFFQAAGIPADIRGHVVCLQASRERSQIPLQQGQAPAHGSDALPQVVFSDGFAAACNVQVIGPVDLQVIQGSGLKSGCSVPRR